MGKVKKDQTLNLNQAYEFHEEDMKHGVKKSLIVQLWGCEKCELEYVPKAGDMVVNLLKRGKCGAILLFCDCIITDFLWRNKSLDCTLKF